MNRKYEILSYIAYTIILCYISMIMKKVGFTCFDLPYYINNIYYLLTFGIFALFLIFQFGSYEMYIKNHASYLVIRYRNYRTIYNLFFIRGLRETFILTVIKSIIDLKIFHVFDVTSLIIYFMVIMALILWHINLEIMVSSKMAMILALGYFAISFSIADLLMEYNMSQFVYCFIPNMLVISRQQNIFVCVIILICLLIVNYIVGRIIIKKKEIY